MWMVHHHAMATREIEEVAARWAARLGAGEVRLILENAKRKLGRGRGRAQTVSVSHYDAELTRLYVRVRGRWRRPPNVGVDYRLAQSMGLTKTKKGSLPREIARWLCTNEQWNVEVVKIFGGSRPGIFTSDPTRLETVARYIRNCVRRYTLIEAAGGARIIWPPWPPTEK
jgi:hypothetical protein